MVIDKATLLEQFEFVSKALPDNIALQSNGNKLSYAQLYENIKHVACYFQQNGVTSGQRVVLVLENSIEFIIAFYAVWAAGGIVVSLNSHARFSEVKNAINQCQPKLVLCDHIEDKGAKLLLSLNVQLLNLSKLSIAGTVPWTEVISNRCRGCWYKADKDTLAQIIYTSGTTSNPKGVLLTHGNLMANIKDIAGYLKLTEEDSVLNVLPFHYCYGNSVLHSHLSVGGKVILGASMVYPQEVVDQIRGTDSTGFYGVASMYNLFLTHTDWASDPPSLRYITQAGGPMGAQLTDKLIHACRSTTSLFVMYGQTEASARITWLPPDCLSTKSGSAGIPLDNIRLEIRDSNGNRIGANQHGEVYISGESVMQGYWNNQIATDKVLANGWLKTGDLGHLDGDGFLYLAGRKDDMIKVGDNRINPLEIEEQINRLDFVSESVIIGVSDELLGNKLVAFIVAEKSKENLFALRKFCKRELAIHKSPKLFKWVEELPKTASGKIQRHKLNY